jgi:beta-galactosidase
VKAGRLGRVKHAAAPNDLGPGIRRDKRGKWLRVPLAAALAIAAPLSSTAQPASTPAEATASARLWMGAAWYPEQWPETRWDKDLALMQAAGVNVVRVGEFAWSTLEPREGVYDLDWLDRAIRAAEKRHIAVVIGTPTDAPPAWLTFRYPETLRIDATGKRAEHGGRRQFSVSSPLYRRFCQDIVSRLAARFGHDPDVVGWQIGNEYTDESFDPDTRRQFQGWLQVRYKTLDALNAAWTTAYWSQTYDRWDEIPLNDAKPANPGLALDHRRFVTDTWRSFQADQLAALKPRIDPRQFTTTNIGGLGWSDNWDHYRVTQDLSLASWDPYVGEGHLDVARNGFMNDFIRGLKRRDFWVMETQPGYVNWAPVNTSLDRGEVRAMAWQDVGHGADAVLYWQWRSALNGQEQYHGALVGPDGEPLPLYDEVAQLGREFAKASPVLAGTEPVSDVAILDTYDSRWAIDVQPFSKDYDQLKVFLGYYRPLRAQVGDVDVVEAGAPLDRYKVVFAPSLNVIDDKLAAHLAAYVHAGGHLVLGPRSGMKDQFNRLNTEREPGPLVHLLGGRVEQFYALDEPTPVIGEAGQGTASIWAETLSARDAQVVLRYGPSRAWTSGQPAAVTRTVGKGRITYLGAVLDPLLMNAFVGDELKAGGVAAVPALPEEVEAMRRVGAGREALILINHGAAAQSVALPSVMTDVLAGGRTRRVELAPQGVAVLTGKDR